MTVSFMPTKGKTGWLLMCIIHSAFVTAYISTPYEHNTVHPTVLKALIFWIHSALGTAEGWVPPEGCGDINMGKNYFLYRSCLYLGGSH